MALRLIRAGVAGVLLTLVAAGTAAASRGDVSVFAPRRWSPSSAPGLLIANQSYFAGTAANQVLLGLDTGEAGAPVYVPANAGVVPGPASAPRRHRHPTRPHRHRHRRHGRSALDRLHRVR